MSNILLFNASNSLKSIHDTVLDTIAPLLEPHALTRRSTRDFGLPLFSIDLEREGYPAAAEDFVTLLHSSDAIVLACPEHNSSVPAAFKNLYDWGTRVARARESTLFAERPVLVLTTSGGARGGQGARAYLEGVLPFHGGKLAAAQSIPKFYDSFPDGRASQESLSLLQQAAAKLKAALA